MNVKTDTMKWDIESSHMCNVPRCVEVESMAELRSWVQDIADSKKVRSDRPAMDEITFRYEIDESIEEVNVTHCYFTDRHGKQRRFMRLRRRT